MSRLSDTTSLQTHPLRVPKILFFGGKGGVGKTTLAAATAAGLANSQLRTLLISTDPAHSIGDLLDVHLGDDPVEVSPGLHVRELDPDRARQDYLTTVKANIRQFSAPEFLQEAERQVELSGQHPGVMESALFEALCRQLDMATQWDRIVIDTAPTGHALHLLSLPQSMQAWTDALLKRQEQNTHLAPEAADRWRRAREVLEARRGLFERCRLLLSHPTQAGFVLVVNDDRLSVREGVRARDTLTQAGMAIPAVIVNRVLQPGLSVSLELTQAFPGLSVLPVPACQPTPQGLSGLEPVIQALRSQGLLPVI